MYVDGLQDPPFGALAHYENEEPRGECVIVVEGKSLKEIEKEKAAAWEDMTVEEHMDLYLEQGMDRKDAMKQVAKDRGISKRDVYQVLVEKSYNIKGARMFSGLQTVYTLPGSWRPAQIRSPRLHHI